MSIPWGRKVGIKVKINGHATRSGKPLCPSCSHAFIRKGAANGQEVTLCRVLYEEAIQITYPIVECSEYREAGLPSLSEMNKIAWFITSDKRPGQAGFNVTKWDKVSQDLKDEVYEADPF